MARRCYDSSYHASHRYGGRGITVCDEWRNDFWAFASWADATYIEGMTIDRTDNDGNYCPDNCRWVTREDNTRNRLPTDRFLAAISRTGLATSIPVICLNTGTTYPSASEAARALGLGSSNICQALKDHTTHTKGFLFAYVGEPADVMAAKICRHRDRPTGGAISIVCTTTGIVYPSITEAALALGMGSGNICRVLKGERGHAGGLVFAYLSRAKEA